jgi:tetratricopeptide (TPR) repeat protein
MPEPESSDSTQAQATTTADETPEPPAPEPEPWTPARVLEWNAYYDIYVVLGVLLLAFVASANKIAHSSIWWQLQAGRLMSEKGGPLTTDPFSYTEAGKRWVNVPWAFEWGHALLDGAARRMVPGDPKDPTVAMPRKDQVGAGALVALDAMARVATVLLVLGVRRRGPGLWWAAVCAALAMGAILNPAGVLLGGIAGPATVAPETWGQMLLAAEVLLLHRAINLGRSGAAWGLVPLFLVWANVDESFLFGLVVLAAAVVGRLVPGRLAKGEADPLPFARGLMVLAACALACLVNPSLHRAYGAALTSSLPFLQPEGDVLTLDQLSFFGPGIRRGGMSGAAPLMTYYLVVVGAGLATFVLNRRNFSLGRLLVYLVAAAAWGMMFRFSGEFAVIFAAVAALNGQEWYLDKFGTAGRLGTSWAVWSIGGRAVTIILVFACIAKALTGWGRDPTEPRFGFGFDPDDFAFEAAESLRTAKIGGNVLNTTSAQGDALIWKASDRRKTFVDSRRHLFPVSLQKELQDIRRALSKDDEAAWKPALDRYGISAVMINQPSAPNTYRVLMQSPRWVPFYDDGNIVMFGRADAPEGDVAYFRARRLDADVLAYTKAAQPAPSTGSPPTPTSWIDSIFRNRALARPQSHDEASRRWLEGAGLGAAPDAAVLPDPARCLMAIREARIALARDPNDTQAYRLLGDAYRLLMIQETALLAGLELTPANAERIVRIEPRPEVAMMRFRQRATALNYAIQSTPPPESAGERQALQRLNLDLSRLYLSANFVDLARDHLRAVIEGTRADDMQPEARTQMRQELGRLDEQVERVQERLDEMNAEQAGPLQRAAAAMSLGAPGIAIQELEEALQINVAPALVKPQLFDLYCDTGQPEKALDLIGTNVDDPTLGSEPGAAALRQGRVYLLLGNYEYATTLWARNAIPQIRFARTFRALTSSQALLLGKVEPSSGIPPQAAQAGPVPFAVTSLMSLPSTTTTQATWEYDLALARLEAGDPESAAEQFTRALTLAPNLSTRPIAAYYLKKLGKPVPPPRTDKDEAKQTTPETRPATPETQPAPAPGDEPKKSGESENK